MRRRQKIGGRATKLRYHRILSTVISIVVLINLTAGRYQSKRVKLTSKELRSTSSVPGSKSCYRRGKKCHYCNDKPHFRQYIRFSMSRMVMGRQERQQSSNNRVMGRRNKCKQRCRHSLKFQRTRRREPRIGETARRWREVSRGRR